MVKSLNVICLRTDCGNTNCELRCTSDRSNRLIDSDSEPDLIDLRHTNYCPGFIDKNADPVVKKQRAFLKMIGQPDPSEKVSDK